MKPRFELERFSDRRLKLMVRFFQTSNFWINEEGEATWVPTFEELEQLNEALVMTNNHNENRNKHIFSFTQNQG
jgi:hypothetical protein